MSAPSPHCCHQTSPRGSVQPVNSVTQPLSPQERENATRVFAAVVDVCEPLQNQEPYKQVTLVRLTYRYARSETSKDSFLRLFFQHTQIPIEASERFSPSHSDYGPRLVAFADTLVENFFLPLKASARKPPQPSPATSSDFRSPQSVTGTTQQLARLRRDCLIRDRYRCVISRTFDFDEAVRRVARDGNDNAQDDEGNLLRSESGTFAPLEVAHIIPYSWTIVSSGTTELDESKRLALAILNMFDDGVVHLIEGTDIDRSRNAVSLTFDLHRLFSGFEVFFEHVGNDPHTYRIDSTDTGILRPRLLPVERPLFPADSQMIDPPSPRLLAVHCAIAHILHSSAAGRHIDSIFEDLDQADMFDEVQRQQAFATKRGYSIFSLYATGQHSKPGRIGVKRSAADELVRQSKIFKLDPPKHFGGGGIKALRNTIKYPQTRVYDATSTAQFFKQGQFASIARIRVG
ncbi:hypothetical protein AYL99_09890 [Fonsecaea erecta]|uniref:HNH nuclease domain-containing protein n=1 Tax=Fonsecaea erecta TaxID=1367422 RepID=A0A178Z7H2_9EURO|nr:hypothetical protein AYL99_09890 [Fonsecaea erecta]OAP55738.1 hypothetical protein AYL99_09890 [Fonsecaea erecta]